MAKMKTKRFRSISLRGVLIDEIQDYIAKEQRYRSVAEFLSESARLRLDELRRLYPIAGKQGA